MNISIDSCFLSRSNSPAQRKAKTNDQKRGDGKLPAASRANPAGQKPSQKIVSTASAVNKSLPGRSVPDLAQKKANVSVTKKKRYLKTLKNEISYKNWVKFWSYFFSEVDPTRQLVVIRLVRNQMTMTTMMIVEVVRTEVTCR